MSSEESLGSIDDVTHNDGATQREYHMFIIGVKDQTISHVSFETDHGLDV